jgi:hypothetical protein
MNYSRLLGTYLISSVGLIPEHRGCPEKGLGVYGSWVGRLSYHLGHAAFGSLVEARVWAWAANVTEIKWLLHT